MEDDTGIEIGELRREDEAAAIRFAIKGMNFNHYVPEGPLLRAYGRYFWCSELQRATQVIAAFDGDRFLGVLLADMEGEPPVRASLWRGLWVKVVGLFERAFADVYGEANREMFTAYLKDGAPDGEICFLAADPDSGRRGIGTALLRELERREPGRRVYLYTDDGCTYQFYEHRGFTRVAERDITIGLGRTQTRLACFLYEKVLPQPAS